MTFFDDGEISMAYSGLSGDLEKGSSATVGIEDHNGANGITYLFESASLDDALGLRFMPPAA